MILKPHGQSFRRQVRLLLSEAKPSYVYSTLKPPGLLSEAMPSYVYSILKPHGQSSRSQVRALLCEAKPSYVYSILKPHGQSSRITDGQLPCTDNHACFCCMPLPLPPPPLPPPLKSLHFWARRSQATYIQHNLEFHHLSRVGPKQLCALAHLGSTREAGTF